MKSVLQMVAVVAAAGLIAGTAGRARAVSSTFDTDVDGWTGGGGGTVQWQSTGGNPGGYLQVLHDANTPDTLAISPAKFTGNLSAYDGQTISFDAGEASTSGTPVANFGLISIFYNGLPTPLTQDIAPTSPGIPWQTYSGPFTAAGFGASPATWATALSSVDSITIDVSAYTPVSAFSPLGLDNVEITPEPGTVGVLIVGGVLMMRRRRIMR